MARIRETIAARVEAEVTKPVDPMELVSEGCIDIAEAASFSGLSPTQLVRHMDNGSLPYVRDGRARRVPKRALKEFLALRLVRRKDLAIIERAS